MVGVLWDSVLWSLLSPCLDALGLPFLLFLWALLLCLGFTCWRFLCCWVVYSSRFAGVHNSYLILYVIWGRVKVKLIKTVGVCSLEIKVPTSGEQTGDPLEKYSNNHENLSN